MCTCACMCFNILTTLVMLSGKSFSHRSPDLFPHEGSPCPRHSSFHPRRRPALSGRWCPPCTTACCTHSRERSTALRHRPNEHVSHEKQLHKQTCWKQKQTGEKQKQGDERRSEATVLLGILTFVTFGENQTSDIMAVQSLGVTGNERVGRNTFSPSE